IKSIDPNHLISFRMLWAGSPGFENSFPYDFRSFKSLDFLGPEAWNIGDPRLGIFTAAYARYVAPGKPLYWAEFGNNVWPRAGLPSSMSYEDMYKMILRSHAHGSAGWFFPGGYRYNERSDFGIVDPDGVPRRPALTIAEYAPRMTAPRTRPNVDTWFAVDRDADVRGLTGIYEKIRNEFQSVALAGKLPGLKDKGTGTTSLNTPLDAVGNVPYNGTNPPKYLNAEFNYVRIKDSSGKWVGVQDDARVDVPANTPITCSVSVGNLQSAAWIAPDNAKGAKGAVYLATTQDSQIQVQVPIPRNVAYFADVDMLDVVLTKGIAEETTVILQMTAKDRAWFGEKLEFTLVPAKHVAR
ncbi:hypothetical protein ACFL01_03800, partial [Planctomycetota bacterium]